MSRRMKTFEATVHVVHMEIWSVGANDEAEASKKFNDLAEDVFDDGGEIVDWEVYSIKEVKP